MKKLVELLLCFFHPLAVVLIWIDLLSRTDISSGAKLAWAILVLIPLLPAILGGLIASVRITLGRMMAAVAVIANLPDGPVQFVGERPIEGVVLERPIQRDRRDRTRPVKQRVLVVGHRRSLRRMLLA